MRVHAGAAFSSYQQASRAGAGKRAEQPAKSDTEPTGKQDKVKVAANKQHAFRASDVKAADKNKGGNFSALA